MASDGSEAEGNTPRTPSKKTPKRANSRQIVRWNDEKLAYAFAEFRLSAQRQRIDIKKALDDAAKCIAPFVTGDALIQQLTKRRTRYIKDQESNETPNVQTGKKTPGKRGIDIKTEIAEEEETFTLETPTSSVKNNPRSKKDFSRQKIKQELQAESSDPDSEYTESPIKSKNKRVRGKKVSPKKKKELDHWSDEDEDDYVDDAGGEISYIEPAAPPSPTAETPSKRAKSEHHKRHSSIRDGEIEDVYIDQHGVQSVDQKPSLHVNSVSPPGIRGSDSLSFYGQDVAAAMDYAEANPPYTGFDGTTLVHDKLQQMSEELQAGDQVFGHSMAFTNATPHTIGANNPMHIFNMMNHNLHPGYHGNTLVGSYATPNTNSSQGVSHSKRTNPGSPQGVKTSPSPVHNDGQHSRKVGSFTNSDTSDSASYHQQQVGSLQVTHGDDSFAFGHIESPGFNEFGALAGQAQDSFGLGNGNAHPDDDGDEYVPTQKQLAHHYNGWGY